MTIDRLARAFVSGHGDQDAPCPPAGALWDAFHATLPGRERRAVVDHLARCPACAADWSLLRVDAVPIGGTSRSAPWRVLLAAAAAALAIVAGIEVGRGPARAPVERAAGGLELLPLTPAGALSREHALLRWSDLGPGVRYTVDVTTEDLELLVTARGLARPEYVVPRAALDRLRPRAVVVWRVEAVLPDGRRVASRGFRAALD